MELGCPITAVEGTIKITDDVLCAIAAIKTMEVNGVVGMSSNLVDGLTNLLGIRSLSQGVKIIDQEDKTLGFNVYVVVKYGYRIPDLALRIQERVKSAVESLTDYTVSGVNVYVQDLLFDDPVEIEEGGSL